MKELVAENLPEIKRVDVSSDVTDSFTSESQYMGLTIDIMIETASYACIAACTLGHNDHWSRDQAAIGGNMVRLYKLLDTLLEQTTNGRGESLFMVSRMAFETLVNIRYLVQNYSKALVDSYVSYSMRHERKLRDRINKNIENRNGEILPIEDRMLKSINRAAAAAEISLDDIDLKDKSPWGGKNTYDKSVAVGLESIYLSVVGGGSHAIHGNWQEIFGNHLDWNEEGIFTPKTEWSNPRPQVLTSMCVLVVETLIIYFAFMCPEKADELFKLP